MSLLPVAAGAALGAFVARSVDGSDEEPAPGLSVVITGGTRGLGKALAREFLWRGDRVLITGRTTDSVVAAVASLRQQTGCAADAITAAVADCSDPRAMAAMAETLSGAGRVDMFICNAGACGGFRAFEDADSCVLEEVVSTTLGGAVLCSHAALRTFSKQRSRGGPRGTLWLTEGAGAAGDATPMYAVYGACKAAIRQFAKSLQAEAPPSAAVGLLSPGLVLTELLLANATERNKAAFNALAEQPETTAAALVPRIRAAHGRAVSRNHARAPHLRYLTAHRAAARMATFPLTRGRFFDAEGRPVYAPEEERIAALAAQRQKQIVESATAPRAGSGSARAKVRVAYALVLVGACLALSCLQL